MEYDNILYMCAKHRSPIDHFEYFIEQGVACHIPNLDVSLVFILAKWATPELCKMAIDNGSDVNYICHKSSGLNTTPVRVAVAEKRPEILKVLLEAGAYPDD